VRKKPKKPKKPKEKDVAWTPAKQTALKELLNERVSVEASGDTFLEWDITRSWIAILNSHITDLIKQNVLNDLIDDKIHYLQIQQNNASASITALQVVIDQGTALKV
jgi:hypothetical protein